LEGGIRPKVRIIELWYGKSFKYGIEVRFIVHLMFYTLDNNKNEVLTMNYELRNVGGHVEVYDMFGRFLFSADSETEAKNEMEEMEAA
jgi:hypothetical protein